MTCLVARTGNTACWLLENAEYHRGTKLIPVMFDVNRAKHFPP